MDIQNIMLYF